MLFRSKVNSVMPSNQVSGVKNLSGQMRLLLVEGNVSCLVLVSNVGASSQTLNQVCPVPASGEFAAGLAGDM